MAVDKATRNKQNAPSRARYEAKAYRKYTIRARTDGGDGFTPEQMEQAAAGSGQSVNAWILAAIRQRVSRCAQQANNIQAVPGGVVLDSPELVQAIQSAADAAGMTAREWVEDVVQRELFG